LLVFRAQRHQGTKEKKENPTCNKNLAAAFTPLPPRSRIGADDLVVGIYQVTHQFPRHELYGLTSQMRRAAISVPANIAEGSGRRTLRDYIRFLYQSKGSLTELEYLLHVANRLGYLSASDFQKLRSDLRQTAGTLLGFIRFKEQQAAASER
jgi:four helix bundle protein